jgi:hypothetical protein
MVVAVGVSPIEKAARTNTVTLAESVPTRAETTATPRLRAVIVPVVPLPVTVATPGVSLFHVTVAPGTAAPAASRTLTVSVLDPPMLAMVSDGAPSDTLAGTGTPVPPSPSPPPPHAVRTNARAPQATCALARRRMWAMRRSRASASCVDRSRVRRAGDGAAAGIGQAEERAAIMAAGLRISSSWARVSSPRSRTMSNTPRSLS